MLYVIEAQHHEELIQEVSSGVETYGRHTNRFRQIMKCAPARFEEIPWE
jgi:hypothetical protein